MEKASGTYAVLHGDFRFEDIIPRFSEIEHWDIAGHSTGGAMTSGFGSGHPESVDGLIDGLILPGSYEEQTAAAIEEFIREQNREEYR